MIQIFSKSCREGANKRTFWQLRVFASSRLIQGA